MNALTAVSRSRWTPGDRVGFCPTLRQWCKDSSRHLGVIGPFSRHPTKAAAALGLDDDIGPEWRPELVAGTERVSCCAGHDDPSGTVEGPKDIGAQMRPECRGASPGRWVEGWSSGRSIKLPG